MLFKCHFGLTGGLSGVKNYEILDCKDEDEALDTAFDLACQEYERYVGLYGLRSISEIMEDENVSEDAAGEIFDEEREQWIFYSVEPV